MDLHINAERFSGGEYTLLYDYYRPSPPIALLEQALRYTEMQQPSLLVDIGCGTGLSTLAWQDKVHKIIGFEPSEDMLSVAYAKAEELENIYFLPAYAHQLPLEDETVDIVNCGQAFHWMEPEATLKEVNRILKPGGVFLIYDCQWPPTFNWQLEEQYRALFNRITELTEQQEEPLAIRWQKKHHLSNVMNSGHFRFVKEAFFHKVENGGKDQFLGVALSQGGLQALLRKGYSEEEIGLANFKKVLEEAPPMEIAPITFHYKAIYAIK
ncbi:MAG: class I SAM-dependent methyltransferase [Chitinophagales bacterium]|nr:class I SAM-dependent methyltransferase [Chitinophagales bacterium]